MVCLKLCVLTVHSTALGCLVVHSSGFVGGCTVLARVLVPSEHAGTSQGTAVRLATLRGAQQTYAACCQLVGGSYTEAWSAVLSGKSNLVVWSVKKANHAVTLASHKQVAPLSLSDRGQEVHSTAEFPAW